MRTKTGIVTSAKMHGTVTVTVHRSVRHPKYGKRFRVSTKFLADSRGQDIREGDEVIIDETRPLSKRKHFRVREVLKRPPADATIQMSDEGEPPTRKDPSSRP